MKTTVLLVHILLVGIWLGCVLTEALLNGLCWVRGENKSGS